MQNTLISSILVDILAVLKDCEKFFEQNEKNKQAVLNKLNFPENCKIYLSTVPQAVFISDLEELAKSMLASPYRNNRKVGVAVIEFLSTFFDYQAEADLEKVFGEDGISHYLLIQSPLKLEPAFKEEIRLSMNKQYPNTPPVFIVNKKLIGGLRIYIDGKVEDLSWLSKIDFLTSLNK